MKVAEAVLVLLRNLRATESCGWCSLRDFQILMGPRSQNDARKGPAAAESLRTAALSHTFSRLS